MSRRDALIGPGDVSGVVRPHVDNGRGDGDRGRRVEHALDKGEIADRRPPEPQPRGGESERLGLKHELCPSVIVVTRIQPGPDTAQFRLGARGAHPFAASVATNSRLAIRPSRSPNRSVRSTLPPGKLPSRWVYTSWRSRPSTVPSAVALRTSTVYS